MAVKCCENCVGLNEKLEKVMKEVEELKRIITAQGVGTGSVQGLNNTDETVSSDYDSEKDEDPRLSAGYDAWVPNYRPKPLPHGHIRKRHRRWPNPFIPFTPHPEPSPNSPPSSSNISSEPSPKHRRIAL